MSLVAADKVFLTLTVAGFGGMVFFIGWGMHWAWTKTTELLGYLTRSTAVYTWKVLSNTGPKGKWVAFWGVVGVLVFSGFYLRHGSLSAQDIESSPKDLKRRISIFYWGGVTNIFLMMALLASMYLGVFCVFGAKIACLGKV